MEEKINIKPIKIGAILSFTLIVLNLVFGLSVTPFIIRHLGLDEYGIYKIVGSISSSMLVLNFGIGSTVQRYVSLYLARGENRKIPNFMAMCLRIALGLNLCILTFGSVIIWIFPNIYGNTLSIDQIKKCCVMLLILTINIIVVVIENLFAGLLIGYSCFIFINSMKIIMLFIRSALIIIAVSYIGNAISLVTITLLCSLMLLITEYIYVKKKLHVSIKYEKWDKELFVETGKYTFLMFLTSIAGQAVTNIDNIVIGAFLGAEVVAVYSIAVYFFNMFQQMSTSIAGVMLPSITLIMNKEDRERRVEKVVTEVGRFQFMLLGAALAGIICVGREFLSLWLGQGFESVYYLILILVIPSMFELCINACVSILIAENKIEFRTYITFASAIVNAILTVLFVKYWSYYGAAIATAISYIMCSLIAMNIYYEKKMHLNMLRIYTGIFNRIWACILVPSAMLLLLNRYLCGTWGAFVSKVLVFCLIYIFLLLIYGLDDEEKKHIFFLKIFKKHC